MRSTKLLRRKPGEATAPDRRSPFDARPFASRQKLSAGKLQRALAEMAEEVDDVAYAEIRDLAAEHNEKLLEKPGDVIPLLHRLDLIDRQATAWLSQFEQAPSEGEAPVAFRKWTRMGHLREEVAEEKTSLKTGLAVTPGAQVLAGPEATLPPGAVWSVDVKKNGVWVDASSITEQDSLPAKITGEQDDQWLFTVNAGKSNGKAAKDQLVLGTRFKDVSELALYPSDTPKLEDVLQTNLGDCYLQAALASLAAEKPGYITSQVIYDAGDKVIVRLYKPPEYSAKNVSVAKSIPENTHGQELYNQGALWVRMVQKAYVASGLGKNPAVDVGPTISYRDIEGKMPGYALGVLLGKPTEAHSASGESGQEEQFEQAKFPWSSDVGIYLLYQQSAKIPNQGEQGFGQYNAARDVLGALFDGVESDMVAWAKFVEDHQDDLEGFRTVEEFTNLFTEEDLDENLGGPVLAWVKTSGLYRGAVGSGRYSLGQISLLGFMDEALTAHRVVMTGTKKEPPEETGAVGGSGEPKYKGLAFGHAYTVLAVRRGASTNPESDEEGPHAWVKVRNPWGHYGRTYDEGWGAQPAEEKGTFWVELNDFANNFKEVEIA
jgi:hypothetical protein